MTVRNAAFTDLPEIMKIYENARTFMRNNGNPDQWNNNFPPEDLIKSDIQKKVSYVLTNGNDEILAVFALISGNDATYERIEGKWLNSNSYATIHRLASSGKEKGVSRLVFDFALNKYSNIRIDTHKNNSFMLNSIKKAGFTECGIIYIEDGTPRIAFQKTK